MLLNAFLALLLSCCIGHQTLALIFEVSPTSLKHSGSDVTVTWKNLSSPSDSDSYWIGVYNPADSDDDLFIGYVSLPIDKDWVNGSGQWTLPLINMREPYQFRLFRGNEASNVSLHAGNLCLRDTSHRLSVSKNVYFENFNEPTQVHLSLASSREELVVMFVTRDPIKSYVRYGLDDNQLDSMVEASSFTYGRSDMCDHPANSSQGWREPGYMHTAAMKNMESGKTYYYKVGSNEGGWSKVFHFISNDGDATETHAFLFGDMGTSAPYGTCLWTQPESQKTVKWLARDLDELGQKPSFISHIGDISYARGYAWLWDLFFTQIEPVASRAPYHVCIGNHEYDWPLQPWKPSWAEQVFGNDGGGECGVPYSSRFLMPGNSSLSTGKGTSLTKNLYYSLDFGVVHFLYISTETDFLANSDQYGFIIRDLESVDRAKTPFLVVLGHRPMYTTEYTSPLVSKLREHLEPLLVKYKVDLALWGHVHKYERTCAIKNFVCVNSTSGWVAPVHVVIGMGGQDWQPHWISSPKFPNDPVYPQPEWSLYRSSELGYTRLYATKDTLTLSYIGNHDGQVHDSVTINSSFGWTSNLNVKSQSKADGGVVSFLLLGVVCLVVGMMCGSGVTYTLLRQASKRKPQGWLPIQNSEDGL